MYSMYSTVLKSLLVFHFVLKDFIRLIITTQGNSRLKQNLSFSVVLDFIVKHTSNTQRLTNFLFQFSLYAILTNIRCIP